MGTKQELEAVIVEVKAAIVAEKIEVHGQLDAHKAEIQALKDQIAAGSPVTAADMDALIASVGEIGTGVRDISEPSVPV